MMICKSLMYLKNILDSFIRSSIGPKGHQDIIFIHKMRNKNLIFKFKRREQLIINNFIKQTRKDKGSPYRYHYCSYTSNSHY